MRTATNSRELLRLKIFLVLFALLVKFFGFAIIETSNFVHNRNDDWAAAGFIVKNLRNFVAEIFFETLHINSSASVNLASFLLDIAANFPDQLFTVAEVNETSRNDVRAAEHAARSALDGDHNGENSFGAHVNAIF